MSHLFTEFRGHGPPRFGKMVGDGSGGVESGQVAGIESDVPLEKERKFPLYQLLYFRLMPVPVDKSGKRG